MPGFLEHLQFLFLGAEDFQSGVAFGIDFLLLRPTCRFDLVQTFLHPRFFLALDLRKTVFKLGFPDGVNIGCNIPFPLLHHSRFALIEPRLCLEFVQALLPEGIGFAGDGIQLVLEIRLIERIRLVHNIPLKVGINLRFLCQAVFVDQMRICALLKELKGFTIQCMNTVLDARVCQCI